jgi:hypothetical protein
VADSEQQLAAGKPGKKGMLAGEAHDEKGVFSKE